MQQIANGVSAIADKAELWANFAPTRERNDIVGDVKLSNRVSELLELPYGSGIRNSVKSLA